MDRVSLDIPTTLEDSGTGDDVPYVIAYMDDGPLGISPTNWPTRVAIAFPSENAARKWWEETGRHRMGRNPKVHLLPLIAVGDKP